MARVNIDHATTRRVGLAEAERRVREVMRSVELAAKIATSTGPYSHTKNLANSVTSRVWVARTVVHAEVEATAEHALVVHNGSQPHIIRPRARFYGNGLYGRGGNLHFYWRKVGHYVNFKKVSHPGMDGKFYLTRPLKVAGARYGFVVETMNI